MTEGWEGYVICMYVDCSKNKQLDFTWKFPLTKTTEKTFPVKLGSVVSLHITRKEKKIHYAALEYSFSTADSLTRIDCDKSTTNVNDMICSPST